MTGNLRFLRAVFGANLRSALEYRTSFLLQAGLMIVNNFTFLAFWAVFFARFRTLQGWDLRDVAMLYAVAATGFGVATTFFGGCLELAQRIATGKLDTWLLRPRPVFLQAASAQMRVSGYGDIITGLLLLALTGNASPARLAAFAVAALVSATVFVAFTTLVSTAAFFAERSEDISQHAMYSLVTFALYPPSVFGGGARVVLYVLLPAGLASYLPAELVRSWDWTTAGQLALGLALLLGATVLAWSRGLARYESGNLTQSVDA